MVAVVDMAAAAEAEDTAVVAEAATAAVVVVEAAVEVETVVTAVPAADISRHPSTSKCYRFAMGKSVHDKKGRQLCLPFCALKFSCPDGQRRARPDVNRTGVFNDAYSSLGTAN